MSKGDERLTKIIVEAINNDSVKQAISAILEEQNKSIVAQVCERIEEKINETKTNIAEKEKYENLLQKAQEKNRKLEEEIVALKVQNDVQMEEKEQKENLIAKYKERIQTLQEECNNKDAVIKNKEAVANQTKKALDATKEEYAIMTETYTNVIRSYELFLKLSDMTKGRLRNIFVADSLESFLSACFEQDNIDGLWNYIRREVIENVDTDIEALKEIFRFMFHGYNARFPQQQYILICPAIGTKYSRDEQLILGTKTDGIIHCVRLEGYKTASGKIIGKALVEV